MLSMGLLSTNLCSVEIDLLLAIQLFATVIIMGICDLVAI